MLPNLVMSCQEPGIIKHLLNFKGSACACNFKNIAKLSDSYSLPDSIVSFFVCSARILFK